MASPSECDVTPGASDQREPCPTVGGESRGKVSHGCAPTRSDFDQVRFGRLQTCDGMVDECAFLVAVIVRGDVEVTSIRFLLMGKHIHCRHRFFLN
jgi:hypothetical protein